MGSGINATGFVDEEAYGIGSACGAIEPDSVMLLGQKAKVFTLFTGLQVDTAITEFTISSDSSFPSEFEITRLDNLKTVILPFDVSKEPPINWNIFKSNVVFFTNDDIGKTIELIINPKYG